MNSPPSVPVITPRTLLPERVPGGHTPSLPPAHPSTNGGFIIYVSFIAREGLVRLVDNLSLDHLWLRDKWSFPPPSQIGRGFYPSAGCYQHEKMKFTTFVAGEKITEMSRVFLRGSLPAGHLSVSRSNLVDENQLPGDEGGGEGWGRERGGGVGTVLVSVLDLGQSVCGCSVQFSSSRVSPCCLIGSQGQ